MIRYISQSPIIPVIFAGLVVIIVLLQCLVKRRFLKVRLVLSLINTFTAVLLLVFFGEIEKKNEAIGNDAYLIWTYICMFTIEVAAFALLFSTIDFSITNEKFQKTLTTSLDETKLFVFLDKKDRVKVISSCFLANLGIEEGQALRKNFFDVIEEKYRIIGMNQEAALKNDLKKFFYRYDKRVQEGVKTPLEINIQSDDGQEGSFYFVEDPIFSRGSYQGRLLMGEMKDEESLMGMEKDLSEAQGELDLIRSRFTTLLYKTNDGIFFNNITNHSIWLNDVLVEKLSLNGNSLDAEEFYSNMHPDDIALYQNVLNNNRGGDYEVTYRYNTGSHYVYIKEIGQKICQNNTVEFCGIMNVIDDFRFEKTNTILDSIGTEAELMNRYKQLLSDENNVFMVAHFKVASIPEINEKYGRPVGNMMLSQYVAYIKSNYVTNNYIYRVSGLEFVAIITSYNRMEALKNSLRNEEKILHVSATYASEKVATEVYMGIAYSSDPGNRRETLNNAKYALKYASNPQFKSSYAFYKDVK